MDIVYRAIFWLWSPNSPFWISAIFTVLVMGVILMVHIVFFGLIHYSIWFLIRIIFHRETPREAIREIRFLTFINTISPPKPNLENLKTMCGEKTKTKNLQDKFGCGDGE